MDMTIRRGQMHEHAAVASCAEAAYAKYVHRIGKKPAPMLADYEKLIGEGVVYVLPAEAGTAGFVVMVPDEQGMCLENIAVHPDWQGRGLGRALIAFVEAEARSRGLRAVHLYTNEAMTENLALYPSLGFEEVGRRTEDGYRRVFFRKVLP